MDILSIRLFLRVAELGVLSAAATDLSLSPASASARLAKLEGTLGFRLFNRTTRAVSLTTDGMAFLPYAQQAMETLETGLNMVSGKSAEPKGLLRIAMPGSFGRMHVIPVLAKFQARYPHVRLDLRLSDEIINIVEGAYDLIIRNARLVDSSMVARKLAEDRRILVASPNYLKKNTPPLVPEDLHNHQCISLGNRRSWKFASGQTIHVPQTITVNDGEAMRVMIEKGMGIGIKSVWNAGVGMHSECLTGVLENYPLEPESSIWALYPSTRVVASKVRAMIDFLIEQFQPVPPWED